MHFKIFKMIATRGFLTAVECTKSVSPLGELTTLPRPPSRLGRGTPLPIPHPPRRLRRLVLGAFGASFPKPPPNYFSRYGPGFSHRFLPAARQTTRFRARMCLFRVRKLKLNIQNSLAENRYFGTDFNMT